MWFVAKAVLKYTDEVPRAAAGTLQLYASQWAVQHVGNGWWRSLSQSTQDPGTEQAPIKAHSTNTFLSL